MISSLETTDSEKKIGTQAGRNQIPLLQLPGPTQGLEGGLQQLYITDSVAVALSSWKHVTTLTDSETKKEASEMNIQSAVQGFKNT